MNLGHVLEFGYRSVDLIFFLTSYYLITHIINESLVYIYNFFRYMVWKVGSGQQYNKIIGKYRGRNSIPWLT